MIPIDFDPSKLTGEERVWWDNWVKRSEAARARVLEDVAAGKRPEFNQQVWSDLKHFLLRAVFNGKCAYCESFILAVDVGDAEHYRPKGRVTKGKLNGNELVSVGGQPHPGYYWLAYNWQNLLPACSLCNSAGGKLNQFPAEEWVAVPEDADDPKSLNQREHPRLLHPYFDTPDKHLAFGEQGVVVARDGDQRGQESIAVYDLTRPDLVARRSEAQENAWNVFASKLFAGPAGKDAALGVLREYKQGKKEYSAAIVALIVSRLQSLTAAASQG